MSTTSVDPVGPTTDATKTSPMIADTAEITSNQALSLNPSPTVSSTSKSGVTHLSPDDLRFVRRALGAPPIYNEDVEPNPKNGTYTKAQKVLPDGLYRTARGMCRRASQRYFFIMILYNFCVILQLVLGAILTALSALALTSNNYSTATTIIAAGNTVNAGIIALLHNSGFPGRLRNDMNEYSKVVEYLEYLMHSGVVSTGMSRDDVVQVARDMYNQARSTVEKNQPSYYVGPVAAGGNTAAAVGTAKLGS